ncbi:MAG: alpha/beta hydrolase [Anaerolineales bacterium]|jgi:pimeloyl-ACP methyl ester carboxylesterase
MEALQNSISNLQINFIERGQGIPVILIHGMAASLHDWKSLLPALEQAGYHGYALDLPGHGESAKPQDVRYYHTEAIYQQLEDWIFSLKLNQPAYLVGHSLGGYFSLDFARRNLPHVLGIALIDPLYTPDQLSTFLRHINRRPDWSEKIWSRIPEWMVNIWMQLDHSHTTRFPDDARQQIAADFKKSMPQIVHTIDGIVDLTPYLPEITVPCLVIWGKRDITLNPAYYPRLVSTLPQAQGLGLAGCGHQPHIERAQKVNSMVKNFFDQLGRPELATPIVEPPKAGG